MKSSKVLQSKTSSELEMTRIKKKTGSSLKRCKWSTSQNPNVLKSVSPYLMCLSGYMMIMQQTSQRCVPLAFAIDTGRESDASREKY